MMIKKAQKAAGSADAMMANMANAKRKTREDPPNNGNERNQIGMAKLMKKPVPDCRSGLWTRDNDEPEAAVLLDDANSKD